ncbi:MAG TPA: 16S rRNA (guanine(966)-N(2))-methyltransferase RsmD [Candidatus Binatia bacterium]|nr:16S rRNA (guanine(966)-N(2))-methyltransferase RsmD [Candidatus Binatia bacterium]
MISGRAKGHRLSMVPGQKTRPIMDRIKENLFNLLGPHAAPGTRWLDLFAGTGQVGIEALSRGATEAVFLDTARAAIKTIHANLSSTRLAEGATVLRKDALAYLRAAGFAPFDYIFVAPPQYRSIWSEVLNILDEDPARYLKPGGLVLVQIDPREFEELELKKLHLVDSRTYGNTMLCFYQGSDRD